MDSDVQLPQNDIDKKARETIDKELANFLKPKNEQTPATNAETVGAAEAKTQNENSFEEQSKLPTKQPSISPIPNPIETKPAGKKPIIRTYKSDMEETVQEGHLSSINIAVSENNKLFKQSTQGDILENKKFKLNKNILIISVVLIIGGALAFSIPYLLVQKQAQPKIQPTKNTVATYNLITTDTEETINTATINLSNVATILQEHVQQSSTALGQIKNIVLTEGTGTAEQSITADQFLKFIGTHIPSSLELTLQPQYMFGLHNFNGNQEFLILKVGDYDTAFSSMLSWENNLWQDFTVLFNLQNATNTTISTSTNSVDDTSTPSINTNTINPFVVTVKNFQDASFDNKDCRVVKDANGNIVFLYSIVDNNTIVITTSTDTLKEIISRLQQANTSSTQ